MLKRPGGKSGGTNPSFGITSNFGLTDSVPLVIIFTTRSFRPLGVDFNGAVIGETLQ